MIDVNDSLLVMISTHDRQSSQMRVIDHQLLSPYSVFRVSICEKYSAIMGQLGLVRELMREIVRAFDTVVLERWRGEYAVSFIFLIASVDS